MGKLAAHERRGSDGHGSAGRSWIAPAHMSPEWPLFVMATHIRVPVASPHHTYYDDSGCNETWSKTFLWAGYAAMVGFWSHFGEEWNKILDGPPYIEYWHQTDARAKNRTTNLKNPFRAYDAADLERCELELCGLLHENRKSMWAFAVQIDHAQRNRHVVGKINNPKWTKAQRDELRPDLMEGPSVLALFYALKRSKIVHSEKPEDRMPVSFFCESRKGDAFQAHMLPIWKYLRDKMPMDYGTLDFPPGKSRQYPQLQAADMLAWHVNHRATRGKKPADHMWKYVKSRMFIDDTIPVSELKSHAKLWRAWPDPPPADLL